MRFAAGPYTAPFSSPSEGRPARRRKEAANKPRREDCRPHRATGEDSVAGTPKCAGAQLGDGPSSITGTWTPERSTICRQRRALEGGDVRRARAKPFTVRSGRAHSFGAAHVGFS